MRIRNSSEILKYNITDWIMIGLHRITPLAWPTISWFTIHMLFSNPQSKSKVGKNLNLPTTPTLPYWASNPSSRRGQHEHLCAIKRRYFQHFWQPLALRASDPSAADWSQMSPQQKPSESRTAKGTTSPGRTLRLSSAWMEHGLALSSSVGLMLLRT